MHKIFFNDDDDNQKQIEESVILLCQKNIFKCLNVFLVIFSQLKELILTV